MKFLIDANVSWRICKSLQAYVAECIHVDYCKLRVPAKDFEIWEFAKTHNYIIITNDEDFINLSTLYGFPPKIVVLKLGNQNNQNIESTLVKYFKDIEIMSDSNDTGILEIVRKM